MNQLIKVGNHEIATKEFKGQRVATFKDIDLVHERPDGTAGRNFRENKERFIEGEDFYNVIGEDLKEIKQATNFVGSNAKEIILITEQGYLMLVKSFTDDLAWEVQRQLVNTYFKVKKPLTAMEMMELQFKALQEVDSKVESVDRDLQTFKKDMPILALEIHKITRAKNHKIVPLMGGKKAPAYKDNSLRGRVYRDMEQQLYREFNIDTYKAIKRSQCELAIRIINNYQLPLVLKEEIENANNQLCLA